MIALNDVKISPRVVLAANRICIRELLRLERGSFVALGSSADTPSELHINGVAVALGDIQVEGARTIFVVEQVVARD